MLPISSLFSLFLYFSHSAMLPACLPFAVVNIHLYLILAIIDNSTYIVETPAFFFLNIILTLKLLFLWHLESYKIREKGEV